MIKVYYASNIDAVNWKIYTDNKKKKIKYFSSATTSTDIVDQLCQCSLFALQEEPDVYVVNIDSWKLADKFIKQNIEQLHNLPNEIIFGLESSTIKNKVFSDLKIECIKATTVTKKVKATTIHELLLNKGIKLDSTTEELFVDLMPDKIDFIQNEITKLTLMNQKSFTQDEIKKIVFDLGDATVFNIVDSWLNDRESEMIERLNDLIAKNITINAFLPIFCLKLVQIKFFLMAKIKRWPMDLITAKQGLSSWQQMLYNNLKPFDFKLDKINSTLEKLYQFDINVKKQKNIPYTQLIQILLK